MQLFRQQALDHQHRLHGEVFLVPPLRWQAIGWLLLITVGAGAIFLIFGSYSRTINATGMLRPAGGVASVRVPENGVLTAVNVKDGGHVRAGEVIAQLSLRQAANGASLTNERREAMQDQHGALERQRQSVRAANGEARQKLTATIDDEKRQIVAIDAQASAQQALIQSSEEELARIKNVAAQGFISGRDMQQRRELLITRRQALAELVQNRSQHRNALASAQIELGQLGEHLQAGLGDYDAQLAELKRERATLGNSSTMDLVASRDGVLTALQARLGDSLAAGSVYGRIVPDTRDYEVELRIPSATITQIGSGQDVRITLLAYPVQDYGTLDATILHVAAAPVEATQPYFIATAKLAPLTAAQRARGIVLRPDLALTARIVLDRQSFFQWLINPLAAVSKR